ncbi:12945_t:CDS:1, partial [Acaulospora colombiana]
KEGSTIEETLNVILNQITDALNKVMTGANAHAQNKVVPLSFITDFYTLEEAVDGDK